ncbi:MAG: hydroxylamine oxidoreductase [Proteobacteria bacterium]|nr:hydroxylamine oxidoreductase [Pseudomonadota bacterium]
MRARYVWIPLIILAILVPAGFYYVDWSKSGSGAGLYSHDWQPDDMFSYWSPKEFYQSVTTVTGTYEGKQCLTCHQGMTPGIVKDWQNSRHAKATPTVYCSDCHGNDHQKLHMPTPDVCANCHEQQHAQFQDEKRFGFPSHALALERAVDANHFVDKPKAEVTACLQCHSVASKCDSCHSRHRFSAAEARKPEACTTCHSGPPHPDEETYFNSVHGKIYSAEGKDWDWSKPLAKGNYRAPTCAYCHMGNGKHQVADKAIWKFGIKQINPLSSGNVVKRQQWIELCADCHDKKWSATQLRAMDMERKRAWKKLYKAEDILRDLRRNDFLYPAADQRPPYPNSWFELYFPRERIGFFDGQASAFYNISPIERDYFEMWYFDNLGAYKGSAHNDGSYVTQGHKGMDKKLKDIRRQADSLIKLGNKEKQLDKKADPGGLWLKGEYTDYNREHN